MSFHSTSWFSKTQSVPGIKRSRTLCQPGQLPYQKWSPLENLAHGAIFSGGWLINFGRVYTGKFITVSYAVSYGFPMLSYSFWFHYLKIATGARPPHVHLKPILSASKNFSHDKSLAIRSLICFDSSGIAISLNEPSSLRTTPWQPSRQSSSWFHQLLEIEWKYAQTLHPKKDRSHTCIPSKGHWSIMLVSPSVLSFHRHPMIHSHHRFSHQGSTSMPKHWRRPGWMVETGGMDFSHPPKKRWKTKNVFFFSDIGTQEILARILDQMVNPPKISKWTFPSTWNPLKPRWPVDQQNRFTR